MLIIIAVKEMTVNKILATINQSLKHFLLQLSLGSFVLEFLQSKIINMRMSRCSYSLWLEAELWRAEYRRKGRSSSNFYLPPGSGHPYKLVCWWWFDTINEGRWYVWWSFLLIWYPLICILSIILLKIYWCYLTKRENIKR